MIRLNKKILQIISVTLLIFPIVSITSIQAIGYNGYNQSLFTEDTDVFVDNFSTINFRDPTSDVFGWGRGTLTNERSINITQLDFLETDNPIRDLVVDGKKAYAVGFNMASFLQTVLAVNIQNPLDIQLLSARDSLSGLISCAIDGDVFYGGVIDSDWATNSIASYNVSLPYNLDAPSDVYEDEVYTNGAVTDISVQGNLVYFTSYNDTGDQSFRIVDAFDPDNLVDYTPIWNTKKALGLEVNRHIAYIAASDEGLYTLNVSDKHSPVELDHLALPGNATDVILDGATAYVSLGISGVAAIDISDPTNINVLDIYNTADYTRHMALQGNTLYVTQGALGVRIFDVVDPTHISPIALIEVDDAWDVELFGEVVVIGTEQGIYTFEVAAEGGGITDFSTTEFASINTGYQVLDVEVIGDIAYIAGGVDGFYTMNVRNPLNPILLDRWVDTGAYLTDLNVNGQFVHCVDDSGHMVFDVRDPNNIQYLKIGIGSDMNDIVNIGGITYAAFQNVIGVANETFPSLLSLSVLDTYATGTNLSCIYVEGRKIFVGDYLGGTGTGIYIISNIDPTNLQLIEYQDGLFSYHNEFVVEGDILYSANGRWLHLWNISDPSIVMLDFVNYGLNNHTTKDVQPFGNYLITANSFIGTHLFDTIDPTDIQLLSTYIESDNASKVAICGDYTYIANFDTLEVLRHFESVGDTYIDDTHLAQSTSIFTMPNGSISAATLNIDAMQLPNPLALTFQMTADGGNWEIVTPGVLHTFADPGTDLRWRATFNGDTYRSPHLYLVEIEYEFEYKRSLIDFSDPMWIAIFAGGGGGLLLIITIIVIVAVVRKKKKAAAPTR
ncbi:MAG: hypothetical protein FK733_11500 [Asgard group archaeon]|nr:hypothetical protein [Asgard group archaeon]